MIFGNRPMRWKAEFILALIGAAAVLFLALPARADNTVGHAGSDADLRRIMLDLQSVKQSQAKFVERKYLHMLNQPLDSSGTLIYVAPDHLEKNTEQPKPERLVVDHESLVIEGGPDGQNRTMALQPRDPKVQAMVNEIRISGRNDRIDTIETIETGGDRSVMTVLPDRP